jgi:hypothetical protein
MQNRAAEQAMQAHIANFNFNHASTSPDHLLRVAAMTTASASSPKAAVFR